MKFTVRFYGPAEDRSAAFSEHVRESQCVPRVGEGIVGMRNSITYRVVDVVHSQEGHGYPIVYVVATFRVNVVPAEVA